jgi:hypothetical protein
MPQNTRRKMGRTNNIRHDPVCLWECGDCTCGAREKLMPMYIKRKKKILKRMSSEVDEKTLSAGWLSGGDCKSLSM